MKYLAISHSTNYLGWAFFDEKKLIEADKIVFTEFEPHKQLLEMYQQLLELVFRFRVGVLVVHKLSINEIKKAHLATYFKYRAIIEIIAAQHNIVYVEAKTDGWELYITRGKNTVKRKLGIVNEGYGINFKKNNANFLFDDVETANAIILGEAMAHRRLYV